MLKWKTLKSKTCHYLFGVVAGFASYVEGLLKLFCPYRTGEFLQLRGPTNIGIRPKVDAPSALFFTTLRIGGGGIPLR